MKIDTVSESDRSDGTLNGGVRKVRVKVQRKLPFCNVSKFDSLKEETGGGDWYINDNAGPYLSSSERRLKEENTHRNRGRKNLNESKKRGEKVVTTKELPFRNVVGKRSGMKLPDKFGVVVSGPYYGKVECSSQLDKREPNLWKFTGDRMKPNKCERKGGYWRDPYK